MAVISDLLLSHVSLSLNFEEILYTQLLGPL